MKRLRWVIVAAGAVGTAVLAGGPAAAHGDITTSSPEAGASVRRPPGAVTVELAEPPADGSTLVVTDPCGEVSDEAQIEGDTMSAPISGDSAGRWRAQVRSISSVDGHLVRESFSFRVRGQRDCSGDDQDDGDDGDDVELGEPQPPLENDETSFPIVPFAVGAAVVVAAALALRRSGRKP